MDFRSFSLEELAVMVAAREISARELVAHSLQMIDLGRDLNAWAALDADRALDAADAIDTAIGTRAPIGPLAGIPIGVKDLENAVGFTTGYGSLLNDGDPPASHDSILTHRLRMAGCVVVGKTTTPEHGWMGDTVSPRTGATLNPWDPARSPGGSSGGSAAALAAGMVPLATGSDGGGSIRIPGSLCGLSTLKPSHGRIPLGDDAPPGAGLLGVRAPMARHARDVAYAMAVCAGSDPRDPFSLPGESITWEIPRQVELPASVVWARAPDFPVDDGVAAACEHAILRLEAAGTDVVVVDKLFARPPLLDWWTLWTVYRERAQGHLRGTPQWELIDPGLRAAMDHARDNATPLRIMSAFDQIHHRNHDLTLALEQAPFVLTPTVASETALSGHSGTVNGDETSQWAPFTQVCNLTRHPAGTVPAGASSAGLPVGIQVIAPHHADASLLRTMAALEELWADLRPASPSS